MSGMNDKLQRLVRHSTAFRNGKAEFNRRATFCLCVSICALSASVLFMVISFIVVVFQ